MARIHVNVRMDRSFKVCWHVLVAAVKRGRKKKWKSGCEETNSLKKQVGVLVEDRRVVLRPLLR